MGLHPVEPRVVAILDGEISTLGHPMVDLNYLLSVLPGGFRANSDVSDLPSQWEMVERYHQGRSLPMISREDWQLFSLLNTFRWVAIVYGVYARIVEGNSGSGNGGKEWWDEIVSTERMVKEGVRTIRAGSSRL